MKHKAPSSITVKGPAGPLMAVSEGDGGLPVLFIHDNAGDATHWADVQHGLQTHTVAFDLRGLGQSGAGHGPFGIEACVEDVLAVADALLPERFVLVGHGFGAAVAGAFAAYYPQRLAGLLYVEPPGDLRKTTAAERAAHLDHFTPAKYGNFHEHWLTGLLLEAKSATRTLVTKTLRTSRREAVAGNVESLYSYDPSEAFSSYKGPTHALVSHARPDSLVGQMPSLARTIAPHTSHWLMLDSPQWFHTELMKFLGECRHAH